MFPARSPRIMATSIVPCPTRSSIASSRRWPCASLRSTSRPSSRRRTSSTSPAFLLTLRSLPSGTPASPPSNVPPRSEGSARCWSVACISVPTSKPGWDITSVNSAPDYRRRKEANMSTEQKVAVITGASQGIGAALVEAYRHRDYRIIAIARSIRPSNDNDILAVAGDIADRRTAERSIAEGVARFGRIDTLVNTAGVFVAKPFTQYSEADYAAMLGVNLAGFFHMTQLAIAEMEKHGGGHIVQITTSLIAHANSNVPSVLASLTKGRLSATTRPLSIRFANP